MSESFRPTVLTVRRKELDPALILWVGPVGMIEVLPDSIMAEALPGIGPVGEMASVELEDLVAFLRHQPAVAAVLSPLFWSGGDGMETARLLQLAGFAKPYRILAPRLPRPELVLKEIRVNCPSLDIGIVAMPQLGME